MAVRADFLAEATNKGGGVVYWDSSGEFSRAELISALEPLGFGKQVPRERSDQTALAVAMKKVRTGPDYLVEPRQDKKLNGTELLHLCRGNGHRNLFRLIGAFKADGGVVSVHEPGDVYSSTELQRFCLQLQAAFDQAKETLPASSVGTTLIRIAKALDGVCMRNQGGLYWIPPQGVTRWKQAVEAIKSAADHGSSAEVYFVDTHLTADSTLALKDALSREVQQAVLEIEQEVTGTKESDPEKRLAKAERLCQKITKYSEVLGESLELMKESLQKAAQAEFLATMQSVIS